MQKEKFNRIKIVLVERNKTNKDMAAAIKKTEATISRWCTNDVQPSVETLYEIAKFLDVEVRELLLPTKSK
jgi:putative transcriptional regulator